METKFQVSEFIAYCNQTLEYAYSNCVIEGEVSSLKTSQGKWVFFDLKDDGGSISCFIPVWSLRVPVEDGMKVVVKGTPKITEWGKFSFTVQQIMPVGQGNIKKSFELLKKKLEKEGLFDPAKKRPLPRDLTNIGIISSTQAAGYADFIKIVNERWGGLNLQVCHTQVQGLAAPDQIIRALNYLNEHSEVEVIAIIRGGGSADDLACFNDEKLVRAIAASKIPVITGIGHEVDESLSDLAADVVASTPSNAAQMLTKDKKAEINNLHDNISRIKNTIISRIDLLANDSNMKVRSVATRIYSEIDSKTHFVLNLEKVLENLNPEKVLKNGYAIVTGKVEIGSTINVETLDYNIGAKVESLKKKEK
jgi:exodeoxyribonuclease VII large subunit